MTGATAILDLERAGFSREQVEALARWQEAGLDVSHLATKADLAALAAATKADLTEVRLEIAEVRREVSSSKVELSKRMFGIAAGQVGLLLAILKLFPGGHP